MKYLYVLVSDNNDFFYEQLLLSIASLRIKMPDAYISLLVDQSTEFTLTGKRAYIKNIINEYKVIVLSERIGKKGRASLLKSSMRKIIEGDFLFIDCDTVIVDDLSEIEQIDIVLGSVLDTHCLIENHYLKRYIKKYEKILGFSYTIQNREYNSGVIFSKDIQLSHIFFDEWHRLIVDAISKNIFLDQKAFNQANVSLNNIISELDGIWNCQLAFGGMRYFIDSKILHYFSSSTGERPYWLANAHFFKKIKECGYVPDEIKEMLKVPNKVFSDNTWLIADKKMLTIINSSSFLLLMKLSSTKIFNIVEGILMEIHFLIRKFKRY